METLWWVQYLFTRHHILVSLCKSSRVLPINAWLKYGRFRRPWCSVFVSFSSVLWVDLRRFGFFKDPIQRQGNDVYKKRTNTRGINCRLIAYLKFHSLIYYYIYDLARTFQAFFYVQPSYSSTSACTQAQYWLWRQLKLQYNGACVCLCLWEHKIRAQCVDISPFILCI